MKNVAVIVSFQFAKNDAHNPEFRSPFWGTRKLPLFYSIYLVNIYKIVVNNLGDKKFITN